jgi:UDP-glucose 4-epimerase|tara:strand:+ start:105 stop:536 length:432 start_codon:yes stop_codon:yes gene_type:complete
MKILITGGAGYIGSTAANKFLDNGHDVTIIDSLITGFKLNIPKKSTFIKCDIGDIEKLKKKKFRTIINCGYGKGYSVLSIINKFNNLLNKKIKYKFVDKRSNDIGYSVADTKKLNHIYKFKNNKNKMSIMINTSISWYKKKNK